MELVTVFLTTFLLVFIGELGDKTQIAAGTGALANRKDMCTIFLSSALALIAVSGLTVYFASLIPNNILPVIVKVGGAMLFLYGIYLYRKSGEPSLENSNIEKNNGWILFLSHFSVVFMAELGDKTQITTLAFAIQNQSHLFLVFVASSVALVAVTALTIWGVTKVPSLYIPIAKKVGAVLMAGYGLYMIFT